MQKDVMKQALDLMSGELKEEIKINLENSKSYTRLFVKICGEIDSMKIILPKYTALKNAILRINKESHSKITTEIKHAVPTTKSTVSVRDIELWLLSAKKRDQLIYYTGSTFERKSHQEETVFRKARNLAFEYDNVPFKDKKYQYMGNIRGEWGCNYKNIITLVQKKVAKQQSEKIWDEEKKNYVPGNIISYALYNYIMVKQ